MFSIDSDFHPSLPDHDHLYGVEGEHIERGSMTALKRVASGFTFFAGLAD